MRFSDLENQTRKQESLYPNMSNECRARRARGRADVDYSTTSVVLALWLLYSGAYMHWISAMPLS